MVPRYMDFFLEKDQYYVSSRDSNSNLRKSNSCIVYFSFVYQLEMGKIRRGKQRKGRRGEGEEKGKVGTGGEGRGESEKERWGRGRWVVGIWQGPSAHRQLWIPGVGLF